MKTVNIEYFEDYYQLHKDYHEEVFGKIENNETIQKYELGFIEIVFAYDIRDIEVWILDKLKKDNPYNYSIFVIDTVPGHKEFIQEYISICSKKNIKLIASTQGSMSGDTNILPNLIQQECKNYESLQSIENNINKFFDFFKRIKNTKIEIHIKEKDVQ